ncbi:MAG: NAD-dependent deacylase [Halobacteriovoraceae bacterium]|nr:NAD-dependent deacylase [Halobacteriovoraceae bacterium]MCB9095175.1 NAD-dependent deacylase [Halobacteriovoraceae bacterium]
MNKVVVLTGAGISQESGIRTFRGEDGLWEGYAVEDVATPQAFKINPDLVLEFYNQRRAALLDKNIVPNAAHIALCEFESKFSGEFVLITQNIDNLHERAGSKNILHMHGELLKVRSEETGEVFEWKEDLHRKSHPQNREDLVGTMRPHIVWFGEAPFEMITIEHALRDCDLFVAIGTSGVVYPAAGLVHSTPKHCRRVEINLEQTPVSPHFHEKRQGRASSEVPQFFQEILNSL